MHTELSLLIRVGDYWHVSDEVGEEESSIRRKVVTELDELIPPLQGWECHVRGDKWVSDPTFECSREVSAVCSEIIVELEGEAKKKHPHLAGSYLPVKINRGRWVGSLISYTNNKTLSSRQLSF